MIRKDREKLTFKIWLSGSLETRFFLGLVIMIKQWLVSGQAE
jgi:hypothetical protein